MFIPRQRGRGFMLHRASGTWGPERAWDEDGYQASYARLSTMWPGSQMFIHSSKRNLLNADHESGPF